MAAMLAAMARAKLGGPRNQCRKWQNHCRSERLTERQAQDLPQAQALREQITHCQRQAAAAEAARAASEALVAGCRGRNQWGVTTFAMQKANTMCVWTVFVLCD